MREDERGGIRDGGFALHASPAAGAGKKTNKGDGMTKGQNSKIGRREFLTIGVGTTVTATAGIPVSTVARADTETNDEKRKARYKADSPAVRAFYRVNRYPAK